MNIQNIDLFEMHEPLTGSFPFAALTAVLPDDISSVSIHWQDTMEILLIREGTGRVSIDLESKEGRYLSDLTRSAAFH